MKKFTFALMIVLCGFLPMMALAQTSSEDGLLARQQLRLDRLENDMRDLRGLLETEMQSMRGELEKIAAAALQSQSSGQAGNRQLLEKLAGIEDSITMLETRFRRSIEMSSDVEFRVLRLEKRLQTLIALSSDPQGAADRLVQQDTKAGGAAPQVTMSRDPDTGETSWSINKDELDSQLSQAETANDAGQNRPAEAAGLTGEVVANDVPAINTDRLPNVNLADDGAPSGAMNRASSQTESGVTGALPAVQDSAPGPLVLPDLSPEEQYRYALGRALQNDLETAEAAFDEFRQLHPDDSRSADALFWLGRVQYMRGRYEKAAMSFTEFNASYPTDSRMVDTTLWIAESVAQFAEAAQACAIYASLPQLLDNPPDSFVKRLAELNASANCAS